MLVACARQHGDESSNALEQPDSATKNASKPADEKARVGAKAIAELKPTELAKRTTPDDAWIETTATFSETADSVDVAYRQRGCARATKYLLFIQDGRDCSDATLQDPRWDGARGEGLPPVSCAGVSNGGRSYYSRAKSESKPWTIGTPEASNVLGHVLVVYDPDSLEALACGEIVRAQDAALSTPQARATGPSQRVRAAIGGMCVGQMIVRDDTHECPKPREVDECATEHCEFDACLESCKDYSACLATAPDDPCSLQFSCEISTECARCTGEVFSCAFGFCPEVLTCAAPVTPGGPCSKLEACCALQGDKSVDCFETVRLIERVSGDPSCYGAMHDWDLNSHLPVPCMFE